MKVCNLTTKADYFEVARVWQDCKELGSSASTEWYRGSQMDNRFFSGLRISGELVAFVDWTARKDGGITINNIGTAKAHRRKGYAKHLVDALARPVRLVTDDDNEGSNAFYERLGFTLLGQKAKRNGKGTKNVWEIW